MNSYGINSEEEVKSQLFSPEDAAKITSMEKTMKGPWIVQFATPEIMHEVLKRSPSKEAQEKHKNVRMSVYRQNPARGGYAGTWGSSRGGPASRGGADPARGGYQSAGGGTTGSDSETNRGRSRGRGGFRGDRGRGRGGRGGERGGKTDGTPAAPPTSAPSAGDS